VKEQRVIRKIEDQASKFKQRSLRSPSDGKRHDRIQKDEQRWMWKAYSELGWSFAKIGSTFDRDRRATKEAVESYKPVGQQTPEPVQPKADSVAKEEAKNQENQRPIQGVLVERDVLELAATFRDDLSRIDALDGAVYQLSGAPWNTDIPSVLHLSHYPELKVITAAEHDHSGQFLLLAEQLEAVSPGFQEAFRDLERRSLTPFISRCQEIVREIWYMARERTGLEMSFDRGYSLPHEYGLLLNVPLFVYRFALEHCTESSPPQPELEISQADVDRFPYLPPHYRQLTCRNYPDLLLAAGYGPVVDYLRGIATDVMDLCQLVTTELCQLYARDGRIREVAKQQEALRKRLEPFLQTISQFLHSFAGR